MKLPEPLDRLKEMRHAKVVGIAVTLILNLAILLVAINMDPDAGYYLMMVGFVPVTFIFPYLFGWRESKRLLALGVGMFLVVGAVNGPLVVHQAYQNDQGEPAVSYTHVDWFRKEYTDLENDTYYTGEAWYRLAGGQVDVFKGGPGTYRFNVTVYSNGTFQEPLRLQLGYARGVWGLGESPEMAETDPADTVYSDGKGYHYDMAIEEAGIYSHWFAVVFGSGTETTSVNTTVEMGPLVGSETDNWKVYIPIGALSMFCNIGLLFLIIVLLYWWLMVAKEKRRTWEKALKEKEDEAESGQDGGKASDDALEEKKPFTCDQCGAPVGADDNFCPKCGERFDGEADEPVKFEKGEEGK